MQRSDSLGRVESFVSESEASIFLIEKDGVGPDDSIVGVWWWGTPLQVQGRGAAGIATHVDRAR